MISMHIAKEVYLDIEECKNHFCECVFLTKWDKPLIHKDLCKKVDVP